MAAPGRTQKQIAERYKGNLGYYKRKHPWRVARFCATFIAIVGGVIGIVAYQKLIFQQKANEEFFSSGKISSHHAKFEQDCAQCHDRTADIPRSSPLSSAIIRNSSASSRRRVILTCSVSITSAISPMTFRR